MEDLENSTSDKPAYKPRSNQQYVLVIDGKMQQGSTDGDGVIDIPIPPGAQSGNLTVGPDKFSVDVALGALDPVDLLSGVQARLNNLGYPCGTPDGELNDLTKNALQYFQKDYGLPITGDIDDATRSKLKDLHGD
jgi:hypothetical protein